MISKIDKYRFASMPLKKINEAFVEACKSGNLELVKYLLLDKDIINAEISCSGNAGIIGACYYGRNNIVKFLLEGKELSNHISPNISNGGLLQTVVIGQNKELMEYLLKNHGRKLHLSQNNDQIFKALMGMFKTHSEMIKHLIVDYNLPRTQEIINFLDEKNRGIQEKKQVNEWFERRELMIKLDAELNNSSNEEIVKPKTRKLKV